MATRTSCPSESWDAYCEQNEPDPREEVVFYWLSHTMLRVRSRIGKEPTVESRYFGTTDGFPVDDAEIVAEGICAWLASMPVLFDVAYLLAREWEAGNVRSEVPVE